MRHDAFEAMSIDELWTLHQPIVSLLAEKLEDEKAKLQDRLDELNRKPGNPGGRSLKRADRDHTAK